jgi:hypothetical protein
MANLHHDNGPDSSAQDVLDRSARTYHSGGGVFEIRIKGHLNDTWSDWLEGLGVNLLDNGEMILSGYIEDQAALMGTLNKIYGLNLTLLSVSKVTQKE